ncbi:hypothetical protein APT59_11135 [Pseudomonas oryzihabitans]|uniref:Uncharacterized protein n=1 Tax=Pseudomonas oryzihabitans TaxID=47885 RepID=A0A0U4P1D2_9PSED|nr:hypothetical protein APT59_11135 [Pseudomonas oryzihabitans]
MRAMGQASVFAPMGWHRRPRHGLSKYLATWNRLRRGTSILTYQLALGRPELMPELTYPLQDVKAEIDAIIWYGRNVQQNLTAEGGYTTRLELEAKLPEDLVANLVGEIRCKWPLSTHS